jgi:hypothetical protein
MYRLRLPGGGLSDMYSLTWAKEHLRSGPFAKPADNDNSKSAASAA